jgi:DNA-binding NtrC family response regulator
VDVRVIATSKKNLDIDAAAGRFRQDLYYRLRALEVRLPTLRERGEDILLLAEHFIRKFSSGPNPKELTLGPEAAARLRRYPWPGNVRELRHGIESTVIVCPGGTIGPECLPDFLQGERAEETDGLFALNLGGKDRIAFSEAVRAFETQLIRWAMQRAQGQQSKAAELLGLPRTTLQSKLSRTNGVEDGQNETGSH